MKKIISSLLLFSIFIAFSCSDIDEDKAGKNGDNAGKEDYTYKGAEVAQSISDLPGCTAETSGQLFYVLDTEEFHYCDGSAFVIVDLTGPQGAPGADGAAGQPGSDGIAINWLGSSAAELASPGLNDAYYNTTDGTAYIWNGSAWQTLVQDGVDGAAGQDWSDVTSTVVDNGDFTVTDYSRALVWKKCSQGQNNDVTCSGTIGIFQYCNFNGNSCNGTDYGILDGGGGGEAWNVCNNETLAGRNWRVPTKEELIDFYDNAYSENIILFPNTTNFYWSATSGGSAYASVVGFTIGYVGNTAKTEEFSVRCVSTGL